MNKQIRKVAIGIMVLFFLLIAQLTRLQVIDANSLLNDSRNGRLTATNFNAPRGSIQTSDGVLLADSVAVNKDLYNGRFERKREYPQGDLYSQLLGFYSFTFGQRGLEEEYDKALRGKDTSLGNSFKPLVQSDYTENLTITVNSKIQQVAKDQLGTRKGAVVALNPKDGSVLAMWSYPSYDNNLLADLDQNKVRDAWNSLNADPRKPMQARAFEEHYPPGSTFKTVTSSAALESAPELVTKSYPVQSSLKVPGSTKPIPNFGGESCGGQMPALLKVSCNTGFAAIGLDLGAKKLYDEARKFGFDTPGNKIPFDEPSTVPSIFPDPTSFINDSPALAKSAIGQQDVTATPLQMALVAAGIANGGSVMKPHLLKELRDSNGDVVRTGGASEWMRALSTDNAAKLRDMMIGVVRGGTGTRAAIPGVQVAGKTGTAQTIGNHSHAWFIGFAPADDPVVAVAVIVEDQPGLGDNTTGGRIAAPIAKAVMQAALAQQSTPNP